jgi:hypothetical protein
MTTLPESSDGDPLASSVPRRRDVLHEDARLLLFFCLVLERVAHATLIVNGIGYTTVTSGAGAAVAVACAACLPSAIAHFVWPPPPKTRKPYLAMRYAIGFGLVGSSLMLIPSLSMHILGMVIVSIFHAEAVSAAATTTNSDGTVEFDQLAHLRNDFVGSLVICTFANGVAALAAVVVLRNKSLYPLIVFMCVTLYSIMLLVVCSCHRGTRDADDPPRVTWSSSTQPDYDVYGHAEEDLIGDSSDEEGGGGGNDDDDGAFLPVSGAGLSRTIPHPLGGHRATQELTAPRRAPPRVRRIVDFSRMAGARLSDVRTGGIPRVDVDTSDVSGVLGPFTHSGDAFEVLGRLIKGRLPNQGTDPAERSFHVVSFWCGFARGSMELARALITVNMTGPDVDTLMAWSVVAYAVAVMAIFPLSRYVTHQVMTSTLSSSVYMMYALGALNAFLGERNVLTLVAIHIVAAFQGECVYSHLRVTCRARASERKSEFVLVLGRLGSANWIGYLLGATLVICMREYSTLNPTGAISMLGLMAISAHVTISKTDPLARTTVDAMRRKRVEVRVPHM